MLSVFEMFSFSAREDRLTEMPFKFSQASATEEFTWIFEAFISCESGKSLVFWLMLLQILLVMFASSR